MRPKLHGRRYLLRFFGLIMLCVALTTTLFISISSQAEASANKVITFQGRLLDSHGGVVPDGNYNVQFRIYEGGSGNVAGNPDGELVWTETYTNNGSNSGVQVKNGSLTVNLGSKTPFGTNVDWNSDTIWLSLNVAGRAANCTTFGTNPCTADGEMLPMKRMTATPYAMNSGSVGGKSANDLVQIGQGVQIDSRSDVSSIFINKTGTGNLLQLQNSATDIFTITNSGDILLGGGNISIGSPSADSITIGTNSASANQDIIIGSGGATAGGNTTIRAKDSVAISTDGKTRAVFSGNENSVTFGNGESSDEPDDFKIKGTDSSYAGTAGGTLRIQGGDATIGNSNGGNIVIGGGSGSGTGASGLVVIKTPTFQAAGQQVCDEDCAVSQTSVDSNGVISLGASEEDVTFTLPDPTIETAGRVIYVTAASSSQDFSLSINNGDDDNVLAITAGSTASLLWNGGDWSVIKAPNLANESLLGSLYYDTSIGKLQCYEASGWGDCGISPDTFMTFTPEYANAVTNGDGIGELTSGICSDTLAINDGSSSQPEVCGTDETYNFYNWTSEELTAQTKSIYVTYQLPSSFKEFKEGLTTLDARTDSNDASVSYQLYRNSGEGLVACGISVSASTGVQTSWQKSVAEASDPANCDFSAGDSVVVRIELTSSNSANAYVSNLGFVFSNQ